MPEFTSILEKYLEYKFIFVVKVDEADEADEEVKLVFAPLQYNKE